MKFNNVIVTSLILVMIVSIGFGSISIVHSYQYKWRLNFAEKHLAIAQGVTDAESQYDEISKTIDILDTFPKKGNYLIYNKYYPTTDMETAWSALYQLKNYTSEIKDLDKTSSAYQLGIYNSQEKISYFKTTLWEAYPTFVYWGAYGWLGELAGFLGSIGFIFSTMFLMVNKTRKAMSRYLLMLITMTFILIMIFGTFVFYIFNVPIFYTGPI